MTSNETTIGSSAAEAFLFPASFAQQRLWFLDQLSPDNPFYNVFTAVRLGGNLQVSALQRAIEAIVCRHEALRTGFRAVAGELKQAVFPAASLSLPVEDWSGQDAAAIERRMQREAIAPFDLAAGQPLRVRLLRLAPSEHILLLTLHHIVADGWSIAVLLRELSLLYAGFRDRRSVPVPELPIQYADFAQWQRDWLRGSVVETQLAYWRGQLADLPPLELPCDRPRPPVQSYRGATTSFQLPRSTVCGLEELSQQAGVTLFVTLLAAFQVLLHRYTGQEDIAVGTPIANRNRQEIEGLIGFFVNTLVMRVDLSGDPTFRQVLERVRKVALEAYAHQDLPFEKLVEALQPDRDLSRSPLVQVVFALHASPAAQLSLLGLDAEFLEVEPPIAKFDLTLSFEHAPQSLKGSLEYCTDLFTAETIARLIAHLETLLAGIIAHPDQPIARLPLLTAADRQQLAAWNRTQRDYPIERSLIERIAAQAQRTPAAIALASSTEQITYRELIARVDRQAEALRRLGVQPEVLVGLRFDRSPDLVIAMLAVWRAGGAYLPLDPDAPTARQQGILAAAGAAIVLTPAGVATVEPERLAAAPAAEAADRLAYVIYTSGSTGQPKGVEIEQRGLLNLMDWHVQRFGITAADRATQIASPAFDAFGWEVFPYLLAGASVHFPAAETRQSPAALRDWLVQTRVTISFLPTPLAEQLWGLDWAETALRWLLVGGDRLHRCPPGLPFTVVNLYGPTEATVVATAGAVAGAPSASPAIGRPIANTQIHLLDNRQQPVPIGAAGEVYLSGDGVARGYRRQPELTADRFLWLESGTRAYRTGDRARYRSNGDLEFLGRTDEQVKIRGFRVELGEVEAAIAQHPGVAAAAVVAAPATGGAQLIAYVTRQAEQSIADLSAHLKARLPSYMLPAQVVELAALPLTATGKLDRRALPRAVQAQVDPPIAPRTALEGVLTELWAEVLGQPIGVDANFFAVGGHSLLATQLVSRMRNVLQVELPLQALFESPTIAELAAHIETLRWATHPAASTTAQREEMEF